MGIGKKVKSEGFKLGYSPERINPGDKAHPLEAIADGESTFARAGSLLSMDCGAAPQDGLCADGRERQAR
jgi:hypothetical protein